MRGIVTIRWKSLYLPSLDRKAIEQRKDRRGHNRCYDTDTGRQVKCPDKGDGGGGKKPRARKEPRHSPKAPTGERLDPVIDSAAHQLQQAMESQDREALQTAWLEFASGAHAGEVRKLARVLGLEDKGDIEEIVRSIKERTQEAASPKGGVSVRKIPTVGQSSRRKKPIMDRSALREGLKEAYDEASLLRGNENGVVSMSSLFRQLERNLNGITPEQFKEELTRLSNEGAISLHEADSIRGLDRPELAIWGGSDDDPRYYNYVLIRDKKPLPPPGKEPPGDPDKRRLEGLSKEGAALIRVLDSPLNTTGAQRRAWTAVQRLLQTGDWSQIYKVAGRLGIRDQGVDVRQQLSTLAVPPKQATITSIRKPARDVITRMFAGTGEFGSVDPWKHDWASSTPELRKDAIEALKEISQEIEYRGHSSAPVQRLIANIEWQASRGV